MDEVHTREVVVRTASSGRSQVGRSRALGASERASILVGRGAGGEHEYEVELHFGTRTRHLKELRESLAQFTKTLGKDGSERRQCSDSAFAFSL